MAGSRSRPGHPPLHVVAFCTSAADRGIWLGGHPSWLPSPLRGTFVDDRDGRLVHEALDMLSRDYRPIDRTQLVNKGVTPLTYSSPGGSSMTVLIRT